MKRFLFYIFTVFYFAQSTAAQCIADNTAFQAGEKLEYKLYFNWKFVWLKAGSATLSTEQASWQGNDAYKCHLITRTSKQLDRFFRLRDTLQSVISPELVPYYYKKSADEGGRYYTDKVWYSYANGETQLKQEYRNPKGEVSHKGTRTKDCVYDMMSMMMRARSFNADDFKEGQHLHFPMADGDKVQNITLIYRGKKNMSMRNSDTTYRCLIFSFVEYENKEEKEIITFYITDDAGHLPVRLDMFLKFGTAKAYLEQTSGLRHPITAIR